MTAALKAPKLAASAAAPEGLAPKITFDFAKNEIVAFAPRLELDRSGSAHAGPAAPVAIGPGDRPLVAGLADRPAKWLGYGAAICGHAIVVAGLLIHLGSAGTPQQALENTIEVEIVAQLPGQPTRETTAGPVEEQPPEPEPVENIQPPTPPDNLPLTAEPVPPADPPKPPPPVEPEPVQQQADEAPKPVSEPLTPPPEPPEVTKPEPEPEPPVSATSEQPIEKAQTQVTTETEIKAQPEPAPEAEIVAPLPPARPAMPKPAAQETPKAKPAPAPVKEKAKAEPRTKPKTSKPTRTATQRTSSPPRPRAASGAQGQRALAGQNAARINAYKSAVAARLARNKPPGSVAAQAQGVVLITFKVSSTGAAQAVRVVRSSGHATLDRAALQTIHRASPFPPPPPGAPRAFTVPMRFNQR